MLFLLELCYEKVFIRHIAPHPSRRYYSRNKLQLFHPQRVQRRLHLHFDVMNLKHFNKWKTNTYQRPSKRVWFGWRGLNTYATTLNNKFFLNKTTLQMHFIYLTSFLLNETLLRGERELLKQRTKKNWQTIYRSCHKRPQRTRNSDGKIMKHQIFWGYIKLLCCIANIFAIPSSFFSILYYMFLSTSEWNCNHLMGFFVIELN